MKATGIVRRIDGLGRVVLPAEMRRTRNLNPGDPIAFFEENNNIILRPYSFQCANPKCREDNSDQLIEINGLKLCKKCVEKFHSECR